MEFPSYFSSSWNDIRTSNQQILLPFQVNSKTHCNISLKDLKKKLLERLSRSEFDETVKWVLEEIFLMPRLNENDIDSREYKGAMTYIVNALKEFCIREISPRCVDTIIEIAQSINYSQSLPDFSRAVSLIAAAPKSKVCVALLSFVCDSNNQQRFKNLKYGNDAQDADQIAEYISLTYMDRNNSVYREYCAFLVVQYYRRQLDLKPTEDLCNVKTQKKRLTKTEKIKRFEILWLRLSSIGNIIGREKQRIRQCVIFKKKFFEKRVYFDNEILCLISAVENIIATIQKNCLPVNYCIFEMEKNLLSLEWLKNHHKIEEEEEEEKEERKEKRKLENEDTFWMRSKWNTKPSGNNKRTKYE